MVYEYQYGYAKRVRDVGNTVTYWQANTQDARGNVTDETLGNGLKTTRAFDAVTGLPSYIRTGPGGGTARQNLNYGWDAVGNLSSRNDANQSLTELFYYDNVYRLDHSTLNGATNLQLYYNTNGNITSKSDLGSYTYHATKVHAAATAGGWSYGYDGNGNVISKNGAAITWFASNLPKSISNGTYGSQFEYGADGNYWKQTASYGSGTETTRYFGGLLEIVQGAVTSWRHQIRVNGVTAAIYNRGSNGVNVTQYLLRDHLGSVDVVTDSAGAVFVKESFAAYGSRRGMNWTGTPSGAEMANIGNATRRGYTDHTMLDNLTLVHMNGRALDPALGRFLSADPYIDASLNTGGWNRYSYVGSNPITYLDPSGFKSLVKYLRYNGTESVPDENGGITPEEVRISESRIRENGLGSGLERGRGNGRLRELERERDGGHGNKGQEDDEEPQVEAEASTPSLRQQCLANNYGDLYETAFALSPLGLAKIAEEVGTHIVQDTVSKEIRREAIRDLYSPHYYRGRLALRGLRMLNGAFAVSSVVGVAATSFVIGAEAYCFLGQ